MSPKVSEMVGVKGMRVQHRAFTYKEKAFNNLGRNGLMHHFSSKISPEEVQDTFWTKHGVDVKIGDARNVARAVERKLFEDEKEDIDLLVTTIMLFSKNFDITNIEAFAMTCHVYQAVGSKGKLNQQQVGEILDRVLPEVNKLRLENWDKFMRILKEVT